MKKKFFIALSIAILVFLGLAFMAAYFINGDTIAEKVKGITTEAVGAPLVFKEKPTLSFFPPALSFGQLSWDFEAKGHHVSLSARKMRIELDAYALLGAKVAFREINLEKPDLVCEYTGNDAGDPGRNPLPSGHQLLPSLLERLVIREGSIKYIAHGSELDFEGINFSVENLQPSHEADIKSDCVISFTAHNNNPWLAGNLAFKGKFRYYAPNITLRQSALTFTPTSGIVPSALAPLQLSFDGGVNLENMRIKVTDAEMLSPQGRVALKGEGGTESPYFKGRCDLDMDMNRCASFLGGDIFFEKNPPVLTSGILTVGKDGATLENMAIKVDAAEGTGFLGVRYPKKEKPASIHGTLHFGRIQMSNILAVRLTGKNSQKREGPALTGEDYPDVDVHLESAGLDYKKIRSGKLSLDLWGRNGTYKLSKASLQWAKGKMEAETSANFLNYDASLDIRGSKLDLGEALRQLEFDGVENGATDFSAKITGSFADNIWTSLAGTGQIEARKTRFSILGSLRSILPLIGKKDLPFTENIESVSARFDMKSGEMTVRPISVRADGLTAKGQALVNLGLRLLDCSLDVKALGIDLPLTFKGPFDNVELGVSPRFLPDIKLDLR